MGHCAESTVTGTWCLPAQLRRPRQGCTCADKIATGGLPGCAVVALSPRRCRPVMMEEACDIAQCGAPCLWAALHPTRSLAWPSDTAHRTPPPSPPTKAFRSAPVLPAHKNRSPVGWCSGFQDTGFSLAATPRGRPSGEVVGTLAAGRTMAELLPQAVLMVSLFHRRSPEPSSSLKDRIRSIGRGNWLAVLSSCCVSQASAAPVLG